MQLGRAYDEPDGSTHVLVDRLWPRGFRRDDPRIDRWLPDVAPSNELRKWYGHQPERHEQFVERFTAELTSPAAQAGLAELRDLAAAGPVTLVTATKSVTLSHLPVIEAALAGLRTGSD